MSDEDIESDSFIINKSHLTKIKDRKREQYIISLLKLACKHIEEYENQRTEAYINWNFGLKQWWEANK